MKICQLFFENTITAAVPLRHKHPMPILKQYKIHFFSFCISTIKYLREQVRLHLNSWENNPIIFSIFSFLILPVKKNVSYKNMPIPKIQSAVKEKGRYVTASLTKTFKLKVIDKVLKLPSLWPINTVTGKVRMKHVRWTNTHKHMTFLLYSTFWWFRQKVRLLVFS